MKTFLLAVVLLTTHFLKAQPWLSPLNIAFSGNGTNFTTPTLFQDSSGVPSITKTDAGEYICAFQWFPAPMMGPGWDSIAVKFSYDTCVSWTSPIHVNFFNMPSNFKRPFDPTVVNAGGGQIRMYFSCGPVGSMSLDTSVNTYSAISTDGINYYFESAARFDSDSLPVIDPAALYFNNTWHYTAPRGAPQAGAFRATSNNGLNFVQAPNISSDAQHQWTGNLMDNGTDMRFYGAGSTGIWWASSLNGTAWGPFNATNITMGGDPAVMQLPNGQYVMIYVGPPSTSSIDENYISGANAYPNPASQVFTYHWGLGTNNATLTMTDINGKAVRTWNNVCGTEMKISTEGIESGAYFLTMTDENGMVDCEKIIIAND
jgi:hypothetical protein